MTPSNRTATVSPQPMTELDAVNLMLMSAGETPLASLLDDTRNADAIQARQTLLSVSREVQLEGWYFNTEYGVKLLPSAPTPGEIVVPYNAVRLDIEPSSPLHYSTLDIVQRGNRLYDLANHTYLFEEGVTATIVYFLPFEELPDAARFYIAVKSARRFRMNVTAGDDNASMISSTDEARARAALMREHTNGIDMVLISPNRNTFLGRSSVGRVLSRRL